MAVCDTDVSFQTQTFCHLHIKQTLLKVLVYLLLQVLTLERKRVKRQIKENQTF